MKKQAFSSYLPSWEYIPDGEPHVFEGRVYVYGSHDRFNGYAYCLNDYICYSAPIDDLSDWRYEGVIYETEADPLNRERYMCLYAPDVTQGPDGRYYMYYVLDGVLIVSVAVCDTPAGAYAFYGYVHYADGTRLGERFGDEPQFDPAVITEGETTYLYTGFAAKGDKSRSGAMVTVLAADMLTIVEAPVFVVPSHAYGAGTCFAGHEFFEASSIRKKGDTYYFVYSSSLMHELCYATSKSPTKDFVYGGVIVSNCDMHIDTYKPAEMKTYYGGNNHGGMVEVNGQWYIFYHRHTNGTNFSRQTCAQPIEILADGSIPQVELTSCGLNGGPLLGRFEYPTYIACNLFSKTVDNNHPTHHESWMDGDFAKITQDGRDGDEEVGYIANMRDGTVAGFKYFECKNVKKIKIRTRAYARGFMEVKLAWDGETLAKIPIAYANIWTVGVADICIPDGVWPLYFEFKGEGGVSFASFALQNG
ncbi:MAG: family 43 glycosylhydrolase [Lachnospiraceae bacterium]|nr:family 43 glycosylhydrolase [Lachnospiraceae bacterium]